MTTSKFIPQHYRSTITLQWRVRDDGRTLKERHDQLSTILGAIGYEVIAIVTNIVGPEDNDNE